MQNEWDKLNAMGNGKCTQDGTKNNEMKASPEIEVLLYIKWGEGVRTGFV